MQDIEVETPGLLLSYKNKEWIGWYVYFQDDGYGGYLILYADGLETHTEGYDAWVENFEDLKQYSEESEWQILWLHKKYSITFFLAPEKIPKACLEKIKAIEIETPGYIQQGEMLGWYFYIKKDESGEYLVAYLKTLDKESEGYEVRAKNIEQLEKYLEETHEKILWLHKKYSIFFLDSSKEIEKSTFEPLEIETPGYIFYGDMEQWYIFIQKDPKKVGAFLILFSKELDERSERYDDRVESIEQLKKYAKEAQWRIEWLDKKYSRYFLGSFKGTSQ